MSSKTPAVLFYGADYLVGIIGMTWDEQGRYMYLLALQQQKGHIDINAIMPDCPGSVLDKFTQDENGLWFNARMQEEMDKRYQYSESRRKNRLQKDKKLSTSQTVDKSRQSVDNSTYDNHMKNICTDICKTYEKHMDNDNDNDNDNNNDKDNNKSNCKGSSDIIAQAFNGIAYDDLDEKDKARITRATYEKLKGDQNVYS